MNADIIAISAPASAAAGDTVIVDVSVKNISNTDWNIAVTAGYESTSVPFQFDYLLVSPVRRWYFVLVYHAVEECESNSLELALGRHSWVQDDLMTKDIAVTVLTPQVSEFKIADFYKV